MNTGSIRVVRVFTCPEPVQIGTRHNGRPWLSGIGRKPVKGYRLRMMPTGLAGDIQANRRPQADGTTMHGGPDKALLVLPMTDRRAWCELLGDSTMTGVSFGENLRVSGLTPERQPLSAASVRLGDCWTWGSTQPHSPTPTLVLQVTKLRMPCDTLAQHLGGLPMIKLARDLALPLGFYMQAIGLLGPKGEIRHLPGDGVPMSTRWPLAWLSRGSGPTVLEAFKTKLPAPV